VNGWWEMRGLVGAEIRRGVVRAYDAGPPKVASVEFVGAMTSTVAAIPVAYEIDGAEMTDGALVVVVMFDGNNPGQGVVLSVYG